MSSAESDYYAFMQFSSESSREGLRHYVPFFAGVEGPVLELGSGRGEFLDVLAEAGLAGRGVDVDTGMVNAATVRGHDVALGDALDHLTEQPDGSVAAVFCAHLLEHLPSTDVARLYAEVGRILVPDGVFVAAVPNAACLSVLGYDFWRDPTHVRFYDPAVLAFFAEQAGLVVTETGGNPRNHPGAPPHLRPPALAAQPSLEEQVSRVVQLATSQGSDEQDGASGPWSELGHVIATMDARLQVTQHQLGALHSAYNRLLDQLYPSNEVYVVARKVGPKPDADA